MTELKNWWYRPQRSGFQTLALKTGRPGLLKQTHYIESCASLLTITAYKYSVRLLLICTLQHHTLDTCTYCEFHLTVHFYDLVLYAMSRTV